MSLVNPLNLQEVIRPRTLAEALSYLARADVTPYPLAGGTELLRDTVAEVGAVLDLGDLGLRYVRVEGDTLYLGATTTLQDVVQSDEVRSTLQGILAQSAYLSAPRVQRHQQTVGGAVVAGASNDDFLVTALALDTQVVFFRPEERDTPHVVPLEEFLLTTRAQFPYLITELRVPLRESTRARLERVSRTLRSSAIVNVAVVLRLDGERIVHARVGAGGVAEHPIRLQAVEALLTNSALSEIDKGEVEASAREAVTPVDDWRASGTYRRYLVGVLVRRALTHLQSTGS